jgi:hypothetical protein
MAVTHKWYRRAFLTTFNKTSDWVGADAVKTSLHTVTYVPNQDADDFFNDATNEVVGTGYTAGGVAITPITESTAVSLEYSLDGADAAWTTASFTCRIGVNYNSTPGTAATNPLLSYVDMGADQTVSAANFTIQWAAAGIVKVTVT